MDGQALVLLVGLDPHAVPGVDGAMVESAIAMGETRLRAEGYTTEYCLVAPDDPGADDAIGAALRAQPWDCVVVGGGVRKPEDQVELFERVVNLVRRHAPDAAIAFNSTPSDTYDAAARWINS
jgi:hypothetical protein